jgi:hypothetical protein
MSLAGIVLNFAVSHNNHVIVVSLKYERREISQDQGRINDVGERDHPNWFQE